MSPTPTPTPTPVVIQGVPWDKDRVRNVARLHALLPDATIVWDSGHDPLATFKAALDAMGERPGILLEDDVLLAANWRERVEEEIAARPDDVIRFFSYIPGEYESRWMAGHTYACNLCTYFPGGAAADLRAYMGERAPRAWREYHDFVVGRWLAARHRDYWLVVPSLVQHMALESTIKPHRRTTRQSGTFVP